MPSRYSLEELADRMAIHDLYARYVHAADDDMLDLLDEVFLPDTVLDWTDAGFIRCDWRQARDSDMMNGRLFSHVFHVCTNILITFDDGRRSARVRSKTIHPVGARTEQGEPRLFQVHGGYADVLVNTEAGWRITERKWRHGWIAGGLHLVKSFGDMVG